MNKDSGKTWYAMLTMNCVPPGNHSFFDGPSSWQAAERSIENFAELLLKAGWLPTFFAAPSCLTKLRKLFLDLEIRGAGLGLLCHPQLSGFQSFLGSYNIDRQREIISLDRTVWEQEMSETVESIRPGFFSANDYTFQAFCMEGFRQGSCSVPGKVDMDRFSHWTETPPYPHHTDPLDRAACGSMEFYEVPVGSDTGTGENCEREQKLFLPPHLRIENPKITEHAQGIFNSIVNNGTDAEADLISFVFITSDTINWENGEDPHTERYRDTLSRLKALAEQHESLLAPATPEHLHELADSVIKRQQAQ